MWNECSTDVAPATFGLELNTERQAELKALSEQLENDGCTYLISDSREALDIIKFVTPYTSTFLVKAPEPISLANHIQMAVPSPGSFIVVRHDSRYHIKYRKHHGLTNDTKHLRLSVKAGMFCYIF